MFTYNFISVEIFKILVFFLVPFFGISCFFDSLRVETGDVGFMLVYSGRNVVNKS